MLLPISCRPTHCHHMKHLHSLVAAFAATILLCSAATAQSRYRTPHSTARGGPGRVAVHQNIDGRMIRGTTVVRKVTTTTGLSTEMVQSCGRVILNSPIRYSGWRKRWYTLTYKSQSQHNMLSESTTTDAGDRRLVSPPAPIGLLP